MKPSNHFLLLSLVLAFFTACDGQTVKHNGPDIQNQQSQTGRPVDIPEKDFSPGWKLKGQKILLTGIVYQPDGNTPAPGVVIYYYQTNTEGRYQHKPDEKRSMPPNELGQTHGYIRGWVKTDSNGRYFIYTVRPGVYPTRDAPAHVHATVKEPNDIKEYYIDDFVFDDDSSLNSAYRKKMQNRCGSGVVRFVKKDSLLIGERNIYLGLNIPDYPVKNNTGENSAKKPGEDIMSFIPYHAWGPDKGTRTCPVCKYGYYHGILYFVGNKPNWAEIKQWLVFLEAESVKRGKYLKVYFIYGNEKDYNKQHREQELEALGRELKLEKTALTFVKSFSDAESDVNLAKINPELENTFLLYRRSNVIGRYFNLKPTTENFSMIIKRLDETINEYFAL